MVIALVITVVFGAMIANPPFSIVGALGVVGGTVLFALAATWTTRTSWGQTDWRDIPVSDEVAMRKFRRVALIQCIIAPLMIGGGVWRVATGDAAGFINVFVGGIVLYVFASTLRSKEKERLEKSTPQDPAA
jgi:hypothetical protein